MMGMLVNMSKYASFIVILQPGSLICERNFAARKCRQLDGNGQIEADSLLIPFQLTISSVNQIMPLESTKIATPRRWSVVLVRSMKCQPVGPSFIMLSWTL